MQAKSAKNMVIALVGGCSLAYLTTIKKISLSDNYEVTIKADFQEGEIREVQVGPDKEDLVMVSKHEGK